MAFTHGKETVVQLDGNDLSSYSNSVEFNREVDSHDTTVFGQNSKRYTGGLKDGTATIEGTYDDDDTSGPRAVIEPLIGSNVELIHQPEGAGTGLAQDIVNVLVNSYNESAPVADMRTWTCEVQFSGDVDTTAQS